VPLGGSASTDTTGVPSVTVSYAAALTLVSPQGLSFPTQAQSTLSASGALTLNNAFGLAPLIVTGVTFAGTDPQDYLITSDGCLGPVVPGASCQIGIGFAPQAQGIRSASLVIASNDPDSPLILPLSGTGGQLPQGPPGQTGATGATGATGSQGPEGPPGQIELVVCKTMKKTVTRHGHKHKVNVQKCTTRLVSGTVKFTAAAGDLRATVARAGVSYATGLAIPTGTRRWQLVLTRRTRRLHRGRYTLVLKTLHSPHRTVERTTVTIN
jgi:hypothetical protein